MIKIDPWRPEPWWFAAGLMFAVLLRKIKQREAE